MGSFGKRRRMRSRVVASVLAAAISGGGTALADDLRVEDEVVVPPRQIEHEYQPAPRAAEPLSDYGEPINMRYVDAEKDAFADERAPNKAVGVAESFAGLIFNTFYFPVKMALGVGGAALGGTIGALSGGDERAAAQIWNVTTDGSYFVTPARLEGRSEFRLTGDHP